MTYEVKNESGQFTNRQKKSGIKAAGHYIWKHRYLYLLLLPAIIYFIVFHYIPMYGVTISFKDYNFKKGILEVTGLDWKILSICLV